MSGQSYLVKSCLQQRKHQGFITTWAKKHKHNPDNSVSTCLTDLHINMINKPSLNGYQSLFALAPVISIANCFYSCTEIQTSITLNRYLYNYVTNVYFFHVKSQMTKGLLKKTECLSVTHILHVSTIIIRQISIKVRAILITAKIIY